MICCYERKNKNEWWYYNYIIVGYDNKIDIHIGSIDSKKVIDYIRVSRSTNERSISYSYQKISLLEILQNNLKISKETIIEYDEESKIYKKEFNEILNIITTGGKNEKI